MGNGVVGAGIVNIITESLYDKPIVVFREYVQNSVDSLRKVREECDEGLCCKFWLENGNLFFLDNGKGIQKDEFLNMMISIAHSGKSRSRDIGYKGIGRLSGISYCDKLIFVNILSFRNKQFQKYVVDADKYNNIKWDDDFASLEFSQAMERIGSISTEYDEIPIVLNKYSAVFDKRDTGFLVILKGLNRVLNQVIKEEQFLDELGWLLPVKYKDELYQDKFKSLFSMLEEMDEDMGMIPAETYDISFNDVRIERPIKEGDLKENNCLIKLNNYAIAILSFPNGRMTIDAKKIFKGIKLYQDNMLLCDEGEIIPMLMQYGYTEHTHNELIQSVRSVGAMIYITDKFLYPNARRTFIEVRDEESLGFLEVLETLVNKIYDARYSVSRYMNRAEQQEAEDEKTEKLRVTAQSKLQDLAEQEITLTPVDKKEVEQYSAQEKEKFIKKQISQQINVLIKEFISSVTDFDNLYENAYDSFIIWLKSRK